MGDAKHKGVEGDVVHKSQAAVSGKAVVYRPAENHAPASVGANARSYSEGTTANISTVKSTEGPVVLGSSVAHKRVVNDKAAAAEQLGAAEHVGVAELEVEEHTSVGAIAKVVDTTLTGTKPYWDASLVIRATSTLEEYGVKPTAVAAPLISPTVGIPASLVHKDLRPNIVPNFRREEAVGLQKQQEHESLDLQMELQELEMEKLIDQLMQTEASIWKQRACIKEEIEGDRNSAYFQAKAKIHQSKAFIEELRTVEGNVLQDQKSIKE
ncbi:hypothetical protein IFM89_017418 [Coptis chinensis]|uniref:Uncharacterized protein n=1 Tax=Coptis chinensis TaxID=261450 RepID=A0A835HNE1_9MAGN|nr:hypothetical protein IFM89_017418 [Coptis chinensis]